MYNLADLPRGTCVNLGAKVLRAQMAMAEHTLAGRAHRWSVAVVEIAPPQRHCQPGDDGVRVRVRSRIWPWTRCSEGSRRWVVVRESR